MRNVKLVLAYDGTDFKGWQTQRRQRTVQQTVEEAIAAVAGERVRLRASGRTDAGVHAQGQVANFHTASGIPIERFPAAINANLPADVVVRRAEVMPEGFDANRDAVEKWYRYTILCSAFRDVFRGRFATVYHHPLDADRMHRAARALRGTHDFRCFETQWPNRTSSVRTVTRCQVARTGDTITVDVAADGFLYNMVRAIVGSLVAVGDGRRPVGWIARLVRLGRRTDAGPTAPPQGLCLMQVTYET